MQSNQHRQRSFLFCLLFTLLSVSGCTTTGNSTSSLDSNIDYHNLPLYHGAAPYTNNYNESRYSSMLPAKVNYGEKVIIVNPRLYAWGAYAEDGHLVKGGIANAGADFCQDEGHPCRTNSGSFRLYSLGNVDCVSKTYPIPKGGALMPYCMFFHEGQSLHGTPDPMLVDANISHGCVHMRIPDAEWLRYNFADVGTKVVIMSY
jgi:hypothetical protein